METVEKYYGKEISVDKNIEIIALNRYKYVNEENTILLTRNIHDCIAILIKSKNMVGMCHINISTNKLYKEGLDIIKKMISDIGDEVNISIFYGTKTPMVECRRLANDLGASIYSSYIDVNEGSIAYDKEDDKFYGFDSDNVFHEYKLGAINMKKDPLQEYFNSQHNRL